MYLSGNLGLNYQRRAFPSLPAISTPPGSGVIAPVPQQPQSEPVSYQDDYAYSAPVPVAVSQPAAQSVPYYDDYAYSAPEPVAVSQPAAQSVPYYDDYAYSAPVSPAAQDDPQAYFDPYARAYDETGDSGYIVDEETETFVLGPNDPATHTIEMYGNEPPPQYYNPLYPVERESAPVVQNIQQPAMQQPSGGKSSSGSGSASVSFNPAITTVVPTNVQTEVSPQISPVFIQQSEPRDSAVSASPAFSAGSSGGGGSGASGGGGGSPRPLQPGSTSFSENSGANWLPILAIAAILGVAVASDNRRERKSHAR